MKICLVSHEYPRPGSTSWGGVGAYTFNMSHALAGAGHAVFVIASGDKPSRKTEGNITVIRLPLNAPKIITRRTAAQALDYSERVKDCVRALHRSEGLDIVEFPDFGAEGYSFLAAALTGPPHVLRLHTCLELVFRNDNRRWSRESHGIAQMEIDAISSAAHITSPSKFLIGLTGGIARISARSVKVAPNPVDTGFFRPAGGAEEAAVLCPGRLQRLKGTHVLIQAIPRVLEKFPRAKFIFAGRDTLSGPDGGSFQAHAESLLDTKSAAATKFTGEVSREEMARLYSRATVVVTPSLYDNFPNTVLEAMACAKPVVAASVGGIPEMMRENEAVLVPPDDPEELALAVNALLADGPLREKIGQNALNAAMTRYAPSIIAAEMTAAYEAAIGKGTMSCACR